MTTRRQTPLPRARKAGPFGRPHHRPDTPRWRWTPLASDSRVLAPGDPFWDDTTILQRRTPAGLTETELLASFNYLDAEALLAFEGIGTTLASNIIAVRVEAQYFASLDELAMVPLIGSKRFERLVGRPPRTGRFRLHDLMRRPRREDIVLRDLRPWSRPAPGIERVVLLRPGEQPPAGPGLEARLEKVRGHQLCFLCSGPVAHGRAAFLIRSLAASLKPLLVS